MTTGSQRRVTSSDVAREAGVARTTVSYVLNQTPNQTIPDSTRQRVLDAAARLGYTPSAAARTLKRGRSDVVLCILGQWPLGSAAGALLAELTAAFEESGLTLVTHIDAPHKRDLEKVWQEISPAAVLSYREIAPARERAMRATGVQSVVLLFSGPSSRSDHVIRPDDTIGQMQAEHLIEKGHRRIGYAWPGSSALDELAAPRLAGARGACTRAGLRGPEVQNVPLDADAAARAVDAWVAGPDPVTAVCAYNDEVAQAIIAGARKVGVEVPDRLAVIGVDDIPTAALIAPALTTIAVDHRLEARRIVDAVDSALTGGSAARVVDPADLFKVIVRESA